MRALFEQVIHLAEESISCLRFSGPVFDCPYHTHPELEILCIEQSEGLCLIGDAMGQFRSGDCFLFGPNLPHMFLNSVHENVPVQAVSRFIQFSPACLGGDLFNLPELQKVASLIRQSRTGLRFASSALPVIHQEITSVFTSKGARKISAFIGLLATLADSPATSVTMPQEHFPETELDSKRMSNVLACIHKKFRQELRLSEVASVANLSPTSFERFFRRHIRRTFSCYLTEIRLSESRRILMTSDKTIAEIAYESGFNNLSNFNRHFKRHHGFPPTQYRAKCRRLSLS